MLLRIPGDVLSVFSAIYAISRHFDVDGSSKDTATELFCLLMGRCIDQCRVYWSCIVPCEMFLELVAFPFSGCFRAPPQHSICLAHFKCYRPSDCLSVTRVDQSSRSQAVARIADRTASQHLWGHVTSSVT